jgi:hypothetical protein
LGWGAGYNLVMLQYPPDTIDDVHLALRGLSHRMELETVPGIPLAAHTVADFRARATCRPTCS